MSDLPRRRIEPLDPPADSFDRVLGVARRRRRNRGLVGASSTMVVVLVAAASFALGASLKETQHIAPSHDGKSPTSGPLPQPSPTPTGPSKSPRAGTAKPGGAPVLLRGRAVDLSGNGIAGLYVLPGNTGQRTFSSDGKVGARTDANGNFTIACPRAPVLLSTWQIDRDYAGGTVGGPWGAAFVGSTSGAPAVPKCGPERVKTTLYTGATLTGHVVDSGPCIADDDYHVWLWLDGVRATSIRLVGLHSGDAFTYSGLPAGEHTLGLRMQTKSVQFAAGATVEANVDFNCNGSTESPEPTTEPPIEQSPTPTPATS